MWNKELAVEILRNYNGAFFKVYPDGGVFASGTDRDVEIVDVEFSNEPDPLDSIETQAAIDTMTEKDKEKSGGFLGRLLGGL